MFDITKFDLSAVAAHMSARIDPAGWERCRVSGNELIVPDELTEAVRAAIAAGPFVQPPRREGTFREFMALFTDAEQNAIYAAEKAAANAGDFTLTLWFDRARGGPTMRLDHPDTIGGVGGLVAAGLLTQSRADEILSADLNG